MKAIAIIPARGGSQRIPRKNVRPFHGKPIINYSIEAAKASGLFDEVWVSTDDWEIGTAAQAQGAMFYPRPKEYALDEVGTQAVVREFLLQMMRLPEWRPTYACCIYPTAPMLAPETLRQAAALCERTFAQYVVPVARWLRDPGQFYYGRTSAFAGSVPLIGKGTRLLQIPLDTDCDINTPSDWNRALSMYANLRDQPVDVAEIMERKECPTCHA